MNRIFKVLWNAATGTFIVTSETAKSRGKKAAAESWRFPHSSVLAVLWSLQMRWPMQGTIPAALTRTPLILPPTPPVSTI
ncbi:ESPR domain-containing protein [Salmonella enterica]